MTGVQYEPIGPWWTLDGPSLRLPTPSGRYVSVWMTGEGPPLALLPPAGASPEWWLPVAPVFAQRLTVMALDIRGPIELADLPAVLVGTGASCLLTADEQMSAAIAATCSYGITIPVVPYLKSPPGAGADGPDAPPPVEVVDRILGVIARESS